VQYAHLQTPNAISKLCRLTNLAQQVFYQLAY